MKQTVELGDVQQEESVHAAVTKMVANRFGAVVVRNADGASVGIFTERDVLKWGAKSTSYDDPVALHMTTDIVCVDHDNSISDSIGLMLKGGFRHLPLTQEGNILGIVSMRDIALELLKHTGQEVDILPMTVAELLVTEEQRNKTMVEVEYDATVDDVVRLMACRDVGCAVIHPRTSRLGVVDNVSIFSERDFMNKVVAPRLIASELLVADVRTDGSEVITVGPHNSLRACLRLMVYLGVRHLPVFDQMYCVAILSLKHIVRAAVHVEADTNH